MVKKDKKTKVTVLMKSINNYIGKYSNLNNNESIYNK